MPPKRKRRVSPSSKGLAAGQRLHRDNFGSSPYGWVGTEVTDASEITSEHILATCGFSNRSRYPFCPNRYAPPVSGHRDATPKTKEVAASGELDDDIIIISDDEAPTCTKKSCKGNPNCLNYIGQQTWEDEDDALETFMKAVKLGENPILDAKDPDLPVGLKNLGATCYANASLQVWFRDLAFRSGVYNCQPSQDAEEKFEESPIFQLQVTFAALQESTQSVFNPAKLVESLQLRTTEQQDAQEFSKLFMSHLDAEFKKQSIPSLRSLVTDQFEGKQVYGTICDNCKYRSERMSNFLEIEINFDSIARLEDRIAALLLPEILSGDNKYLCSQCNSLQDATRYTELRELPPVLHFSLLRFVYDVSSMERKKSKHVIKFPKTLDMNRYLGTASNRKTAADNEENENIYELRGVLLHKGASAYHGHYEAQVFDATEQAWFQFNDEVVTKIQSLGDKHTPGKNDIVIDLEDDDEDKKASSSQIRKERANNARKRRRVADSDDEVTELPRVSGALSRTPDSNATDIISSKDAYMLIYARKEVCPSDDQATMLIDAPAPPPRALEVVKSLNAAHDEACEVFSAKESHTKLLFQDTRRKVMAIYQRWNLSSGSQESVVVSQQALESWLSTHAIASVLELDKYRQGDETSLLPPCRPIAIKDIICPHGNLDPTKANMMKRITDAAYARIAEDTNCYFEPCLTPDAVCRDCVVAKFTERLYQLEHPRIVERFDQVSEIGVEAAGYWISKFWLRDWRLAKPRMHVVGEGDPGPDTPEFDAHVRCEHDALTLNSTTRRRISVEACELLTGLYPSWIPISADTEPCAVCDALINVSREDKRETRKRAEEEKAKLRHMHENALTGNSILLEDVPCALVPAQFVRSWRQWLTRPTESSRPETIDNTVFLCEHDKLVLDPNSSADLDVSVVAVIKRSDWNILENLYSGGPLISLEKITQDGDPFPRYVHDVPVCEDCRQKRKSAWESTDITIRRCGPKDPLTGQGELESSSVVRVTKTYGSKNSNGSRQSKRLRQVKEHGERRKFIITKHMTVKDIKIALSTELDIPTICQRLFYRGKELEDNTATVESLGILANDVIDLREESEEVGSDSDGEPKRKKSRAAERGFGGTLLGGMPRPSSATPPDSSSPVQLTEKSCATCTFSNPYDASKCDMCEVVFN